YSMMHVCVEYSMMDVCVEYSMMHVCVEYSMMHVFGKYSMMHVCGEYSMMHVCGEYSMMHSSTLSSDSSCCNHLPPVLAGWEWQMGPADAYVALWVTCVLCGSDYMAQ
ncbi:hypothetical protein DPMN_015614, partial [Dreissena polymorpha]